MDHELEWKAQDVGGAPEILRLAEEVRDSEMPRLLEKDGEAMAVVVPVALAEECGLRGPITPADIQAFRATAGGWKDFDGDGFLRDVYESRGITRPPVDL